MPFFPVLLVDVQGTFRLLTDEQYGADLYLVTTAKSPCVHEWSSSRLVVGKPEAFRLPRQDAVQATFAPFSLTGLVSSPLMAFQPMPWSRRPLPFDHLEWIFELKYDGFRSLAVIRDGRTELISRNGHPFSLDLRVALHACKTVLDGEMVCVDEQGRPQFRDLLFHRGEPCFFAFDLLMSDGKDIRSGRLTDRKQELRRLLFNIPESRVRYADHIEREGIALFKRMCEMDLEGIVASHSFGPYASETKWFKINNRSYSQMQGREELFKWERHREPIPGWHTVN